MGVDDGMALESRPCDQDSSMNKGIIGSQRDGYKTHMAVLFRLAPPAQLDHRLVLKCHGCGQSGPHRSGF
jgi:hypothetical protein